ncbi:hypothetical protein LAZ67_1003714 [Cordylochernes scorpioides]|uniref:Uncharacterized protein n=1 Tax=Cordylochernes scorpioides TaxID=51811 RepID=A0ABY6JXV4_9ARAC|nr:hypothetical protein LAZ67_1003714 [Cordylochernes scorpioides]
MLLMNSMLTFKVAQEMALAHEAAVKNVAEIKDGKPQEEINVMGRAVKIGIGLEWISYGDSVCQINKVMNGNGMAAAMNGNGNGAKYGNGNGMAAAMNGNGNGMAAYMNGNGMAAMMNGNGGKYANGMMSGANGMGAGYMNGGEDMYSEGDGLSVYGNPGVDFHFSPRCPRPASNADNRSFLDTMPIRRDPPRLEETPGPSRPIRNRRLPEYFKDCVTNWGAKMEEQTDQSNDSTEPSVPKQGTTFEEEERSPPQGTYADPLTQIADALSKLLVARPPREIDVSPYDGTLEAQSFFDNFDAQADRAKLTYTDRLRKLPCYLQEASFARFLAIKLTPQMPLEDYYQNKTVMGMKLNLPADILIESLTEGLPVADQRLIATVQPNTIKEWFNLVSRIRRTQCATSAAYQRQVDKAPHLTYHNPPPRYNNQRSSRATYQVTPPPSPCKYCNAMHWHSQCEQRFPQSRTRQVYSARPRTTTVPKRGTHTRPKVQPLSPVPQSKLQAKTTLQAPRATQRESVTSGNQNSAQERHILVLLEAAITRWSPYTRGLSLIGRARAANSLVLFSVVHHIHGYLPTDRTTHKIQARLARFIWGPERTAWFPGSVLARPVSLGGFGLIDIETQLRLSCFKGVQAALRGSRNAYSWLVESGTWLHPPLSGSWLSPRRLRLLKIWEAVADIFTLDHSVLTPHQLLNLPIIGGCRLLRAPDLLAPTRWVSACIGDFAGPAPPFTRPTRCALADAASLTSFSRRLIDENQRGTYRVNTIGQAVVLRGTTTPFLRVITQTARRMLERRRLTALPIIQFARRLAMYALPHPAHPSSAQQSCIACGSGDLSLVHQYWSCRCIRPLIREAFTIIGRPPDLQGWVFGHGLDDDTLAILASAKTRIYSRGSGCVMGFPHWDSKRQRQV